MKPFLANPRRAKIVAVLLLLAFIAISTVQSPGSNDSFGTVRSKIGAGDMSSAGDSFDWGYRVGQSVRNAGGLQLAILLLILMFLVYAFWPRRT